MYVCMTVPHSALLMHLPELLWHGCNDIHQPGLGGQTIATGDLCLEPAWEV